MVTYLPKFSKFSPAAQKKEDFWLHSLPKFSKISPAALKMEGFFNEKGRVMFFP